MITIADYLRQRTYPGRGIMIGRTAAGLPAVYYFIMGRSANSRNRIFVTEPDGIRTQAFDESKLEDPSLIIYHPVRTVASELVVTNGDQTDTIRDALERGGDFRSALMTREYEPDAPNWTPRISGIVHADGSFELSILKHGEGGPVAPDVISCDVNGDCTVNNLSVCNRYFFAFEDVLWGTGRFISTYQDDGSPLPSFAGEPVEVAVSTPDETWAALNADNKVALYTNVGGKVRLYNKHLGD